MPQIYKVENASIIRSLKWPKVNDLNDVSFSSTANSSEPFDQTILPRIFGAIKDGISPAVTNDSDCSS